MFITSNVTGFCSVVVITSASHAEGRRFEPCQKHTFRKTLKQENKCFSFTSTKNVTHFRCLFFPPVSNYGNLHFPQICLHKYGEAVVILLLSSGSIDLTCKMFIFRNIYRCKSSIFRSLCYSLWVVSVV